MITSNFFDSTMNLSNEGGSFYVVSDSLSKYANMAESHIIEDNGQGGNDHFISTMKAVSDLWRRYSAGEVKSLVKEIKGSHSLISWFSMIVCMILYAREGGNHLSVRSLSFNEMPFYRIWKNKFFFSGKDDNKTSGGAEKEECLNIYEFVHGDLSTAAGCCSKEFYVIPPREVTANNIVHQPWKKLYLDMISKPNELEDFIDELSIDRKIMLRLSALSMPDDKPLKMVKDILVNVIGVYGDDLEKAEGMKCGDITYYITDCHGITESVFLDELFLMEIDGVYASLFPFSQMVRPYIENGRCTVNDLKLEVNSDGSGEQLKIRSASVKGVFTFSVKVIGNEGRSITLNRRFEAEQYYPHELIWNSINLRTFCMYPDIPFEYEGICRQYTYFSNESSFIINMLPNGSTGRCVDLSENWISYTDHSCLECFEEIFDNSKQLTSRGKDRLVISSASAQKHLINVLSPLKTVIGCLINYRGLHAKCDPLLYDDSTYNIDLSSKYGERRDTLLDIYVDFGSSSSAIGYKFAKGDLDYTSITGGTPLVRELLASADKKRYSNFINFADDCYVRTAPSVSITYEGDKADDFIPYHNGWQPFMNKFTEFELKKIVTDVSHKTGLIHNDKSQSPQLIISSLCFTALCHAANLGCRNVMFYPSLPNKNYTDYLGFIWDNVLDTMKKVFDINTSHLLRSKDNHFLYESIAFSNGAMDAGRNVMIVNIDMGDSTTDFSAVYTDKFGHRKICGYSSIEYAGKNLLKESLRNILAHMDSVRTAKKFMLGSDSSNPFIIRSFYDDVSENIAENICMKFFPNDKRKGRPRNDSWQNLFMQLLQTASINTASGKDSINVKAKADIILRYAVLIPVIRDFTAVSLDLCESDKNTAVTIHISGGAAKGFMLADEFVNGSLSFTERINKYIKANFEGSYGICSVEIADGDPKFQLIKGLSRLDSHKDGDGTYSIYMADGEDGISIDWDRIKPNSVDHYSDPKRIKKCSGFRFRKIEKVEDITYNIEQRSKPSSCIPEDVYGDMRIFMKEILDHFLFEKEFRALTDNSFFTNASKATIDGIRRQFFRDDPESGGTDTSFKKAADSEIYPEMIKNAAYMFEVSRLLSHNFGKTFSSADAAAEGKDNGFSI